MKTIITTLYKFNELDLSTQQKAIDRYYDFNVNYNWWESIYEDSQTIGLKITSFNLDSKQITGEFMFNASEVAKEILYNHGTMCETYKIADKFCNTEYSEGENTESQFLNDLLKCYIKDLQIDYNYRTSKEQVIESLSNDNYFNLKGELDNSTTDTPNYREQLQAIKQCLLNDIKSEVQRIKASKKGSERFKAPVSDNVNELIEILENLQLIK